MGCLFTRSMAVALVLVSGAAASAQSLADVARREEERRKSVAKAGKVYTNDQLPPAPPVSAPRPASGAVAPSKPAQPEAAAPDAPAGDAAKPADPVSRRWNDRRMGGASAWPTEREALSRSQILADALQSRINALTTDFENRDDPAQRSVIFADRQKALAELDRVKKEIAAAPKGHHHDPGRSTARRRSRRLDPVRVVVLSSSPRRRQRFASRHAAPRARDAGARGRRSARRA